MTARRVWAAVPYKGPVGSKRRLAPLLDDDERARLSLAMLDGVLDALLGVVAIERVLLLTPWQRGLPARPGRARHHAGSSGGPIPHHLDRLLDRSGQDGRAPRGRADDRLTIVDEAPDLAPMDGHDNLNSALRRAQAVALAGGADALLIVPADLPLLQSSDIAKLLQGAKGAGVSIAKDRLGSGTNALLLAPPGAIEPSFGVKSFSRHRDLAQRAGWTQSRGCGVGFALDLDTPDDVAALLSSGRDSYVVRLLREMGVDRRLDGLAPTQARSTTI